MMRTMRMPKGSRQIFLRVTCPRCHAMRDVAAGEIPADDYPMCSSCALPMLPVKVVHR